jgi:hypothetical protein
MLTFRISLAFLLATCAFSSLRAQSLDSENVKRDLLAAASAHRVDIDPERLSFGGHGSTTIALAPIKGAEQLTERDFTAGAQILLLIIKSTDRGDVPSGSYVVKVQYGRRARTGTASFMDQKGAVVRQQRLYVRTWVEARILFPEVYSGNDPGPANIPVVTSTHIWSWKWKKWVVDCAGWMPYRVVYF